MASTQRFRIEESDNDQVTLVRVKEETIEDSLTHALATCDAADKEADRDWPQSSFQDQSGSRIVLCRRPSASSSAQEQQESYRYAGATYESTYSRLLDYYRLQSGFSFDKRGTYSQSHGDSLMTQAGSTGFSALLDNVIKVKNVAELNDGVEGSVKQEAEDEDVDVCTSPTPSQSSSSLLLGEEAADDRRSMQMRRREQNKYATQRYRMRKKCEVDRIHREEQDLVNRNRQLKHRVLNLVAEVARLKVCLRTRLQASGVPLITIKTLLASKNTDNQMNR